MPAVPEGLRWFLPALLAEKSSACLVDRDGRILAVNAAWDAFSDENGGGPRSRGEGVLGQSWLGFVSGDEVRRPLADAFQRVLRGGVVAIRSECSSATVARLLASRLVPVRVPGGAVGGVAMIHDVVRAAPVEEVHRIAPADDTRYLADGVLPMCSGCRRVRRVEDPLRWDFVPEYVSSRRRDISHGICGTCLALMYLAPA